MRKWNASMPRDKTPEGGADVVLAFRMASGERVELECKMANVDARDLMGTAIEMMKNYKEKKNG